MKKLLVFTALILSISIFSCSKKKPENNPSSSFIKMEIGGDAKKWEASKGVVIGTSQTDGKHNFTMTGIDQDFEGQASSLSIIFSQNSEIGVGNYVLGNSSDGGGAITKVNGKTYMVGKGVSDIGLSIEISEVSGNGPSKKFKGRFQGQLTGPAPGDRIGVTGTFSSF